MASAPPVQEEPLQPGMKPFRSQFAAAVRSISWSYAIFWSISTSRPGVLTWNDGFYNGEVKTRKISNSADLTADELVLQRSEQLRELYDSLMSGVCDHRARRPVAALSPEDLGNAEWYYVICMTYVFRPGQGLPGKCFASNGSVWLCNAQSAESKTFARVLLAKSASIQTIVCVPFMSGVLELGTTDLVSEDPNLVERITTSFREPQFSVRLEVPVSSPSPNETGDADDIVLEDLIIHNAIEEEHQMVQPGGEHELGDVVFADQRVSSNANDDGLEQITMEIDEFYSLCEELDLDTALSLEDDNSYWPVNAGSSPEAVAVPAANDVDGTVVSITSCFMAWNRANSDELAVPDTTGIESQKLLKKTVDGGAWMSNDGRGSVPMTQESSIKNHVMSERRRREKLNEMFLILKSLVPSIHKMDKASILAETIAYLKELEKRVKELEFNSEPARQRPTKIRGQQQREITGKEIANVGVGGGDAGRNHHWILSQKGPSNVNVTVTDKVVHLDVRCQWKELLMTRVFDAIKSLCLDILSVQTSTPDGLFGLKIQAKFACSGEVAPGMIIEALQKAIGT